MKYGLLNIGFMAVLAAAPVAQAQTWPTKALVWVVPYPAGGSTDILARVVAPRLGERLGQSVVIENRTGAGGVVGTAYGARQPGDGYTLIMGNIGPIAVSPSLYKDLTYDPLKDLRPVRIMMGIPNVMTVHPNAGLDTLEKISKEGQRDPIPYGTPGATTSPHLAGELFALSVGTRLMHVPYKGSAPAITDLIAGHVPMMFDNLPASLPHIKSGKIQALAVTTKDRVPELPDVPTMQELGVKGYEVTGWTGVFVPAATPEDRVQRLYKELDAVMSDPQVQKQIAELGGQNLSGTPEDFKTFVASEQEKWRRVTTEAGIVLQ